VVELDVVVDPLTANDRCDTRSCGAQAYVRVTGVSGVLLFCGHHYEQIVNNAVGYDKMMKFAFNVEDNRESLIENRLKDNGS
jgi:hypothetical protein